eukprot:CAMPEP_0197037648 /NCGR_PEP_ID=MMETSP1384-20130603/14800_1 /TAXON_ID=29189 /ORGANISM="Ammonia sp." /LENGTH=212 /DNA_ID=CAMNT_0042467975 /DNA_START=74 /DNA_END=712 /DNA_ORIENTATION=+
MFRPNLLQRILSQTNNAIKRRPVFWAVSLAALEGMFSDGFTQRVIERKNESDFQWYRLKTFGLFNIYVASVDYFVVNTLLPKIFPTPGIVAVIGKVFLFEFASIPFYYFPVFYYVRQALHDGNNFSWQSFQVGLQHYQQNYKHDLLSMWAVWIPTSTVAFTVVPKHLILPFFICVDLCWLIGLSLYRGDVDKIKHKGSDHELESMHGNTEID